jgi:putative transposase
VGSELLWLWVVIEPENEKILSALNISKERNMLLIAEERLLSRIVKEYRNHPVSTDGDGRTWYYPQTCRFRNLDHHIQSPYEKNIIERIIQYIKDRTTESFDDYYFPCLKKKNCKLKHMKQWFDSFAFHYNRNIMS